MRQPVVDYREFRLSRLNEPRFSHLKLLLGWVVYFALYFLTENLIPVENCHSVHMWLDDVIPFNEYFVIPYTFWYLLIVFSLGYFALYDIPKFRGLQIYIMVTQFVAMAVYILYPTRQDLRPESFANDNFFTRVIGFMYVFDTNTNVCPSLHVGYSLGIMSIWLKEKTAHPLWKAFVVVAVILICLSTMFIKQHSAVDFFAALPMCLVAEIISCGGYWKEKLQRKAV
ncbi:MAG: phosphatidic acid phosphatase [Clostridia bacterium]|nr:phosphatidic acid phosphatase [Clostridia bacterium]